MMLEELKVLLDRNVRIYVACTGAGAGIQKALWDVPGCSSFFVGGTYPYDYYATDDFLGVVPKQFCSEETAADLAMAAYMRACNPKDKAKPVGLGLTASVASTKAHRGDHRIHAAVMTPEGLFLDSQVIPKGVGENARLTDGRLADAMGLRMLLDVTRGNTAGLEDWSVKGRRQFFERPLFTQSGRRCPSSSFCYLDRLGGAPRMMPGAFNPPHPGHFGPAEVIGREGPVVFTITSDHAHKRELSLGDMLQRASFLRGHNVLFTENDPLFIDKARKFPNTGFIVGADAVLQMLDPKWGYEIKPLLQEFEKLGTTFHVVGRLMDGKFVSVQDSLKQVPVRYYGLFREIPGRWDVSSKEIRESAA